MVFGWQSHQVDIIEIVLTWQTRIYGRYTHARWDTYAIIDVGYITSTSNLFVNFAVFHTHMYIYIDRLLGASAICSKSFLYTYLHNILYIHGLLYYIYGIIHNTIYLILSIFLSI